MSQHHDNAVVDSLFASDQDPSLAESSGPQGQPNMFLFAGLGTRAVSIGCTTIFEGTLCTASAMQLAPGTP